MCVYRNKILVVKIYPTLIIKPESKIKGCKWKFWKMCLPTEWPRKYSRGIVDATVGAVVFRGIQLKHYCFKALLYEGRRPLECDEVSLGTSRRFKESYCLHFHGQAIFFNKSDTAPPAPPSFLCWWRDYGANPCLLQFHHYKLCGLLDTEYGDIRIFRSSRKISPNDAASRLRKLPSLAKAL
jgi:hypothetical protein